MSYSYTTYTGDGVTTSYAVPFPYLSQDHVEVRVAGVLKTVTTHYLWTTPSTIQILSAPASGATVNISRHSNRAVRLVDYQDGSTLTQALLDSDANQTFYMAQEAIDNTDNVISVSLADSQWDAKGNRITNVGSPAADQDAVTRYWSNVTLTNQILATASAANAASLAAAQAAAATANNAATTATAAAASVQGLSMTGMGLANGSAYDLGLVADILTLYLTDCGTVP